MDIVGGQSFNPANGPSSFSAQSASTGGIVILHNLSPFDLILTFNNDPSRQGILHAWQPREFDFCGKSTSTIAYAAAYQPSAGIVQSAPNSFVWGEAYAPGEPIPKSHPNYDRLSNVGNTVTTQGGSANVKNDGNSAGTSIIEATPSDQTASSWSFNNDGSGFIHVLSANVLRTVIAVTRGNNTTTKSATVIGDSADTGITTLYGTVGAGSVVPAAVVGAGYPATALAAGALPAGVTLPATQLTTGAIGLGVTLPATQLTAGALTTGITLPATQLTAGALPAGVTLPATQVTAGALGASITLPATQITAGALPSGVTLAATQLTTGAIPAGVSLPATQVSAGALASGVTLTTITSDAGAITTDGAGNFTSVGNLTFKASPGIISSLQSGASATYVRVSSWTGTAAQQIAAFGINLSNSHPFCFGADGLLYLGGAVANAGYISTMQSGVSALGFAFRVWTGSAAATPFSVGGQFHSAPSYVDASGNLTVGGTVSAPTGTITTVTATTVNATNLSGMLATATANIGVTFKDQSGNVEFDAAAPAATARGILFAGWDGTALHAGFSISSAGLAAIGTNRSGTVTMAEIYTGSATPTGDGVTTPRTGAMWAKA